MYSVILVDDENIVLEGLKKIIDWNSLGFKIIGTADDGKSCLKLLQTMSPDLIISDIKMREIDGLELISIIRSEIEKQPKVIFLTGYNDFGYAKEALKQRARNYLLKPIVEDELIDSLIQVKSELDAEKKINVVIGDYEKINTQNKVAGLLLDSSLDESLDFLNNNTNLPDYDYFRCGEIQIRPVQTREIQQLPKIKTMIEDRCNQVLDGYNLSDEMESFLFPINELNFGLLMAYNSDYQIHEYIERLSSRLKNMIPMNNEYTIHVSYGKKVKKLSRFQKSYETAEYASKFLIYYDNRSQITYTDIEDYSITKIDFSKILTVDSLVKAVVTNEYETIYSYFSSNFMVFKKDRVNMDDVIIFVNKIYLDCNKELENYCPSLTYDKEELFYSIKERMPTISTLMKEVLDFSLWVSDCIQESGKKSTTKDEIVEYIDEHFRESITLKMIAEKFYVNPVYLGQALQKKLKIGFKKYLENLRMEEAKRLLRTSDKPIYEIAFEVGYNDPEYFSRVFYKAYGTTPSQYKHQ